MYHSLTAGWLSALSFLAACADPAPLPDVSAGSASGGRAALEAGCAGSRYPTIQAAIDAAADGDVISVCRGSYRERLTVARKFVTLRARDGARSATIDARGVGRALTVTEGATVVVSGLVLADGMDPVSGGVVSCSASRLVIDQAVLVSGVSGRGGALAATDCITEISRTTLQDNRAWAGGAVWQSGGLLTVRNSTVSGNHADYAGGGIYSEVGLELSDSLIEGNDAEYGAGVYAIWSGRNIRRNTFVENVSLDDGAGLYVLWGSPRVAGNRFERNDSGDEGGGLRVKTSTARIEGNTFVSNHAQYRGGGVKVSHGASVITGNTFTANTTWVSGGAMLLEESASTLTANHFEANTAEYGGALYIIAGWDDVLVEDGTFVDNTARDDGGHIYVDLPGQTTTLRRVELVGGEADLGGAVYALASDVELENVALWQNAASVSGGALYIDQATGELTNAVLWDNQAPEGSGITVVAGAAFDVRNVAFGAGTAPALHVASGLAPTVAYSAFDTTQIPATGMLDPVGTNGNFSGFTDFVGPDVGDFRLLPDSPLIDAGDPAVLDADGTRSDVGRHGGPEAL